MSDLLSLTFGAETKNLLGDPTRLYALLHGWAQQFVAQRELYLQWLTNGLSARQGPDSLKPLKAAVLLHRKGALRWDIECQIARHSMADVGCRVLVTVLVPAIWAALGNV